MEDDIREDRTPNGFVLKKRTHWKVRGPPETNVVDCAAALLQRVIEEATYDQMYAGDEDNDDKDADKGTVKVSFVLHTRCHCACASHEQGCLIARKRSRQVTQVEATPLQTDLRTKRTCNEETPEVTVPFTCKTRVIFLNQEEDEQAAGQIWYTDDENEESDAA